MSDINEATAIALAEMKACRKAALDLGAAYGRHSGIYRESHHLTECIDEMAHLLTGNKEYFWEKHHSTPGPALPEGYGWRDHVKDRSGGQNED